MKTAVLFDLDGVVVDTESQYTHFWQEVGKRDFPDMPDFAQRIKGSTLDTVFREYYATADEEARKALFKQLVDFEAKMSYPPVPGIVDFLLQLRGAGCQTAVVTSSNQAKMSQLYAAWPEITQYFDRIFTAEDARRSKPAPDCYLDAARALGFEASQCFVFEDSVNGVKAGRASGATVIGLDTTNPATVIAPYCHLVIHDFRGLDVARMEEAAPSASL